MINPLICTIWCAVQAHEFAPGIPVWGWKVFFAVAFTLLNLQGIKTSARVNAGLTIGMSAVVIVVFVTAIRYILGHPHSDPGFFTRPFYDPQTFTWGNLFGCTSIAVLSYIGFDAISKFVSPWSWIPSLLVWFDLGIAIWLFCTFACLGGFHFAARREEDKIRFAANEKELEILKRLRGKEEAAEKRLTSPQGHAEPPLPRPPGRGAWSSMLLLFGTVLWLASRQTKT